MYVYVLKVRLHFPILNYKLILLKCLLMISGLNNTITRNTLTFSIIFGFSKFSYMSPCNILGAILKFSNSKEKIDSLLK